MNLTARLCILCLVITLAGAGLAETPTFLELKPAYASIYASCLTVDIYGANLYENQPTKVRMYEVGRNLPYVGWQAMYFSVTDGIGTNPDRIQANFSLSSLRYRLNAASATDYMTTSVSSTVSTTVGNKIYRIQLFKGTKASSSVVTVTSTIRTYASPVINWISPYTLVNASVTAREFPTFQVGGSGFYENAMVMMSTSTSMATVVSRNVTATTLTNFFKKSGANCNVGSNLTTQMNLFYYWTPRPSGSTNRPLTDGWIGATTLFPAGIYYFSVVNPSEPVLKTLSYPTSAQIGAPANDPTGAGNVIFAGGAPNIAGNRGAFIFGQDKGLAATDMNSRARFNLSEHTESECEFYTTLALFHDAVEKMDSSKIQAVFTFKDAGTMWEKIVLVKQP